MENTVYSSSVSLYCYYSYCFCESLYLYYCTDREATVRIKRSLKIWKILSLAALFLSIGMTAIGVLQAVETDSLVFISTLFSGLMVSNLK